MPDFRMSEAQLMRIREERAAVFTRWKDLAPGDALEIPFDRRTRSTA
jgi:hypothetical protein